MSCTFFTGVGINSEDCTDHPDGAQFSFSRSEVLEILELMNEVKKRGLKSIDKWDSRVIWLVFSPDNVPDENENPEFTDCSLDGERLVIRGDEIYFLADFKHSGFEIGTNSITRQELESVLSETTGMQLSWYELGRIIGSIPPDRIHDTATVYLAGSEESFAVEEMVVMEESRFCQDMQGSCKLDGVLDGGHHIMVINA